MMPSLLCSILLMANVLFIAAQHPTCDTRTGVYSGKMETTCLAYGPGVDGYQLPGNFDVSLLAADVSMLAIHNGGGSNSVVYDNASPLPTRPTLKIFDLSFSNMEPSHPRFSLNKFLSNNRQTIESVGLSRVKLLALNKEDFKGFNRLDSLRLTDCEITSVGLNAFEELGALPNGALQPAVLKTLYIAGGSTFGFGLSLDWSFLKPVANSLETISLIDMDSSKLTTSSPFKLAKATTNSFRFSNPNDAKVPRVISNSFNRDLDIFVEVSGDTGAAYCCRDCKCFDLKDYERWLGSDSASHYITRCQEAQASRYVTERTLFSTKMLYDNCVASAPLAPPNIFRSSTTAPDQEEAEQPFTVTCTKSKVTIPELDVEELTSTTAEYVGDGSRKCVNAAYDLNLWILEKTGTATPRKRRSVTAADGGVKATCTGKGVIKVNEEDPDEVTSGRVSVETETTKKCRDFYFAFVEKLMSL